MELIDIQNEVLQEMVHLPTDLRTIYYFKESFAAKLSLYKNVTAKGLVEMYTNMVDYKVGDEMKVAKVAKKIESDNGKEDTLIMMKKVTVRVSDELRNSGRTTSVKIDENKKLTETTKKQENAVIHPDSTHDEHEEQDKNKVHSGEAQTETTVNKDEELKENNTKENKDKTNKEDEKKEDAIKKDEDKIEDNTEINAEKEVNKDVGCGDGQTGVTDGQKKGGVTNDDKTSGEGDGPRGLTDVDKEEGDVNKGSTIGEGDGHTMDSGDENKKGVKLDENKIEDKEIKEAIGDKETEQEEDEDKNKIDKNSEAKEEETALEERNEKLKDDFTKKDEDDDEGGDSLTKTNTNETDMATEGNLVIDESKANEDEATGNEETNETGDNENEDESGEEETSSGESEGDSVGGTEESEGSGDGQTEESDGTSAKSDDDEHCYNGR